MLAESVFLALGLLSFSPARSVPSTHLPVAKFVAPQHQAPVRLHGSTASVVTTGQAAVLVDGKSGAILSSHEGTRVLPIASLTKLMTAMVVLDAKGDLDEPIELLKEDEPLEGRVVIGRGETLTRRQLLQALLIGSVNSAGNALARSTPGGKEAFVKAMNAKAEELGLTSARFTDPTGLDRTNVASAQDVAFMLRNALFYNDIREITKQPSVDLTGKTGRRYVIQSTNLLLDSFLNKKPYTILAGKTGSLPEAGFCFAQAVQDGEGNELIAVTLGSTDHFSRYQDVKSLTAWGFESFGWQK